MVLDPDTMGGSSREPPEYQLVGLGEGREVARVFFPATCLTRSVDGYNMVHGIETSPGGLTVDVWERFTMPPAASVFYRLDNRLSLVEAHWSDAFALTGRARNYPDEGGAATEPHSVMLTQSASQGDASCVAPAGPCPRPLDAPPLQVPRCVQS